MISVEKPGSPSEVLEHVGVLGMKWGHHTGESSTSTTKAPMSKKKKVAIGVGVVATVAGAAFVTHKLNQSGKIALPGQNRSNIDIDRIIQKHGSIKLSKIEKTTKFWNTPNQWPKSFTQETIKMLTDLKNPNRWG